MKHNFLERGQGITEYAILLMVVGGMLVALLASMGMSLEKIYCSATNALYRGDMPEEGGTGYAICQQLLSGDHEGDGNHGDHGDGDHGDGDHGGEHGGEHGAVLPAMWDYPIYIT
ncbi:MAG: hypothetical protein Fur0018_02730 [Anaerolineales bacterium]